MENEIGTPQLVVDLYNRFSRSGRAWQDSDPAPMSPEDSASLRAFIETNCAPAHRAICAYQVRQGMDWFTSEHAARFLDAEYYITRRVLDARERGVLCFRDLSFLNNQLTLFAPRNTCRLTGSLPVGAYVMPATGPKAGFDTELLHGLDEITWPPVNPVQQIKEVALPGFVWVEVD